MEKYRTIYNLKYVSNYGASVVYNVVDSYEECQKYIKDGWILVDEAKLIETQASNKDDMFIQGYIAGKHGLEALQSDKETYQRLYEEARLILIGVVNDQK